MSTARSAQPKARRKSSSKERSVLSTKATASAPGESAAVHHAQPSLADFGDGANEGDHDSALVKTVESLPVTENDASGHPQEEEARTVGGIPSR